MQGHNAQASGIRVCVGASRDLVLSGAKGLKPKALNRSV